MEIARSKNTSISILLTDSVGAPLTGLTETDVVVTLKKAKSYYSNLVHTPYIKTFVMGENFREVDSSLLPGVYEIDLTPIDTNVPGNLTLMIRGDNGSGVALQTLNFTVTPQKQDSVPNVTKLVGTPLSVNLPLVPRRGESLVNAYISGVIKLRRSLANSDATSTLPMDDTLWKETTTSGTYGITIEDDMAVGTHTFEVYRHSIDLPLLDAFVTYTDGSESIPNGFGGELQDVFFENENVGWAIIRKSPSTILRTTDGGGKWVPVTDPIVASAENLNVIDGAYDAGDDAFHIFTAGDGEDVYWWDGTTWSVLTSHATTSGRCLDIHARTSEDVWLVGATAAGDFYGRFISRWDGTLMTSITLPAVLGEDDSLNGDALYSVYSTSLNVVHVCGGGRYARSANGGSTWNDSINSSFPVGLQRSVHFWDSNRGFVLGKSGITFTTNGGTTWSFSYNPIPSGTGIQCRAISFNTVVVTTTTAVWVTGTTWVKVSTYGGRGISFLGDLGPNMSSQKLRIAGTTVLLDNVTGEVKDESTGYYFTVSVEADLGTALTPTIENIYTDTQALIPLVKESLDKKTLTALVSEGDTLTLSAQLEDSNGPVEGVSNIDYQFYKNGQLEIGTLGFSEIGSGMYQLGIPSDLTTTRGDLVLSLKPGTGSVVNWNYNVIEETGNVFYSHAITTWLGEGISYGFIAGTIGGTPTSYYSEDLSTWQVDTVFNALGPYVDGGVIQATSQKVGSTLVVAVIVYDWTREVNTLLVKVGASPWADYNVDFDGGEGEVVAIEDVDKVWVASSAGNVGMWNGTTFSAISTYGHEPIAFSGMIVQGGSLWLTSLDGYLIAYNTSTEAFTDITSSLPGKSAFSRLLFIVKKGTTILVGGEEGIWMSTNNGSSFSKQTLPSEGVDFEGDPVTPNLNMEYSTGGFYKSTPLASTGSVLLYFTGTTWEVASVDPLFQNTLLQLSNDGYGAIEYDPTNVAYGVWVPPSISFFEQMFRFAVLGGDVDLSPVLDSIAEVKGVGFNTTTDSLLAVRTSLDSIEVDLSPVLDSIAEVKGVGFDTEEDSLVNAKNRLAGLEEALARNLGLSQENLRISGQQYDGNGNLIASVIKIYPSGVDVVADTNPIAEYTLTVAYDANNRLVDYQFVRT